MELTSKAVTKAVNYSSREKTPPPENAPKIKERSLCIMHCDVSCI